MSQPNSKTFSLIIQGESGEYTLSVKIDQQECLKQSLEWMPTPAFERIQTNLNISNESIPVGDLVELGQDIYKAIFSSEVRTLLENVKTQQSKQMSVRIQLIIDAFDLHYIAWEVMHDGLVFLATQSDTPIVRTLHTAKQIDSLQVRGALRILFVSASPENKVALNTQETITEIRQLLGETITKKRIIFDTLDNTTPSELYNALRKDYHILCFAGHGTPNEIYLDDGQGEINPENGQRYPGDAISITAADLAQHLDGKPTRLVILTACRTSAQPNESSGPLANFAQALINQADVPAVVAMQTPISNLQANEFTAHLLSALSTYRPVDVAVVEARKTLIKKGNINRDVFAPVLWLQAENSQLFRRSLNPVTVGLTFALGVTVLLVLGTILFAMQTSDTSQARVLAQRAELELTGEFPERGVVLSLLALRDYPYTAEAEAALYQSIWQSPARLVYRGQSPNFSPDGESIVSIHAFIDEAAPDRSINYAYIQINDTQTGEQQHLIPSYTTDVIKEVLYSPDGDHLAWTTTEGIIIWNISMEEAKGLNETGVVDIDYNSDGTQLVTANGAEIVVWDLITNRALLQIEDAARTFDLSPDDKHLATNKDGEVTLWDISTGEVVTSWIAHESRPDTMGVLFSPDGKHLLTLGDGLENQSAVIWHVETQERYIVLNNVTADIFYAAFSPDGKQLVTVDFGDFITIWDTVSGQRLKQFGGHRFTAFGSASAPADYVSFHPDGHKFVTGGYDVTVRVWEPYFDTVPITLPALSPNDIAFNPQGTLIASTNGDASIQVWEIPSEQSEKILSTKFVQPKIIFSPLDQTIWSIDSTNIEDRDELVIQDYNTGEILKTYPHYGHNLAFSPDGQSAAITRMGFSGMDPNQPPEESIVIDTETGELLFALDTQNFSEPVQYSPDEELIATAGSVVIELWDADTGWLEQRIPAHPEDSVADIDFIFDSQRIISVGASDNTARVWDISTGLQLLEVNLPENANCVDVSADGKRFAVDSGENAMVWNVETGEQIVTLYTGDELQCVQFSPDDRYLATVSTAGDITQLWPMWQTPQPLLEYAQECCVVRGLDQHDFEELGNIFNPLSLRNIAGQQHPIQFLIFVLSLYAGLGSIFWIVSRPSFLEPKPISNAQTGRFQKLLQVSSRLLIAILSNLLMTFAIVVLLSLSDPATGSQLIAHLVIITPLFLGVSVLYIHSTWSNKGKLFWLSIPFLSLFTGVLAGFMGGGLGGLLTVEYFLNADPLVSGIFLSTWESALLYSQSFPDDSGNIQQYQLIFALLEAIIFGLLVGSLSFISSFVYMIGRGVISIFNRNK